MLKHLSLVLLFGFTTLFTNVSAADETPTQTVQTAVDAILGILTDPALDKEARRVKMRAIINRRFDFRAMSQSTLATNWKKASDDEQQKFVELFALLIQNSYIGKVEAYTGEVVEYPGESIKGKRAVVDTLIVTSSKEIPVNYKVYNKKGEWLVYDVIIEGVSLISSYRSTYREIVKQDGFSGLFVRMEEKLRELDEMEQQPS